MARTNDEVARALGELATLTEIDEGSPQAFRVRAYQNAQRAIETLTRDVADLSACELAQLKGIGKSTAAKIREYVETGTMAKLEALRAKHPVGKQELLKVPGLGPKTIGLLDELLGVRDLDGLRAAIDGRTDRRAARAWARRPRRTCSARSTSSACRRSRPGSRSYVAVPLAERLVGRLRGIDGVEQAEYAGSVRRFRETIGDLDILVATTDAGRRSPRRSSAFGEVAQIIGSGATKTSVLTSEGVQVDLRVVPPESFGAALLYFTGSKAHNIRLRQRALKRGLTLNEYALARLPPEVEADARRRRGSTGRRPPRPRGGGAADRGRHLRGARPALDRRRAARGRGRDRSAEAGDRARRS